MWCRTATSCILDSMYRTHRKHILLKAAFWLILFLPAAGCRQDTPISTPEEATDAQVYDVISKAMTEQEDAWNRGDLSAFMEHYQKSDSLVFIGSRGLNYGWNTTLENYRKSYPDKEHMGRLLFTNKRMERLGPKAAFVIGQWQLFRTADTLGGHYSLIWKQVSDKWVITADHSS